MLILQKIFAVQNIVNTFFNKNYLISIKNHFYQGYEFPYKNQFLFSKKKHEFLKSKELIEVRFLCGLNYIVKTHDVPFFLDKTFYMVRSPVFVMIPYYYGSIDPSDERCVSYECQYEVKILFFLKTQKVKLFFFEYTPFEEHQSLKKMVQNIFKKKSFFNENEEFYNHNTIKNILKSKQILPQNSIIQSIHNIIEHMKKGDTYLANITHTHTINESENIFDPINFLKKWFYHKPTFGFYLDKDDIGVMCFSPERFLIKRGNKIATQPIKGTQKIGKPVLWKKSKEIYEHTMVVDLLRNDLNDVCRPGSVVVQNPFYIKCASTILHMESTIFGILKNCDPQFLHKLLPGGSITGTPKKRTCELIQRYESKSRGYYTGIAGIIENNKDFDFSILIRSIFKGRRGIYTGVGAGITTLSFPSDEFKEFCLKLESFL